MRVAAGIFLIILFIPLFLIGVLAATVRFQILDTNFWLSTFSENNVYEDLASVIKKYAEDKTVSGGGNTKDVTVLTSLITPQNVQDGVSKNLTNFLNFANGESRELDVYIPIDKVPKDLLPATFDERANTIPLEAVLASLNVHGFGRAQLNIISNLGLWSWALLITDLILLFIVLVLLFLLTAKGKKFWDIGVGSLLSGLIIIAVFVISEGIRRSMSSDWPKSTEPFSRILATFTPFIFQRVLFLWLAIGLCAVVIGALLFFLERPVYNKQK